MAVSFCSLSGPFHASSVLLFTFFFLVLSEFTPKLSTVHYPGRLSSGIYLHFPNPSSFLFSLCPVQTQYNPLFSSNLSSFRVSQSWNLLCISNDIVKSKMVPHNKPSSLLIHNKMPTVKPIQTSHYHLGNLVTSTPAGGRKDCQDEHRLREERPSYTQGPHASIFQHDRPQTGYTKAEVGHAAGGNLELGYTQGNDTELILLSLQVDTPKPALSKPETPVTGILRQAVVKTEKS